MSLGSLFISGAALIVSMISFYFSRKSWRESNRPIVSVRVTTHSGGNVASFLDLLVENTGNRPAKNIKLSVEAEKLKAALLAKEQARKQIENCFSDRGVIPVLANGRSVSNGFGSLSRGSEQEDWIRHSKFDVLVAYEDLDGRKYKHNMPILIADDKGFAGGFWSSDQEK